ncbi:hypothetical protein PRZ48_006807 [Zasmidium cellare]|uniref:BTB domain-containing protein n=1 Tax=Zasmidium cellare TaxID=395010 RepID=A0ABR0EHL1_ZASCE|nr:hypothetical protein PRZ48_006807 [Zasmidium cellare]
MSNTERPNKRRKLEFGEEFKLVVGAALEGEVKSYTVQKDFLVKSSEFFRGACNKEWKEGQTKVIKLPETAPEAFEVYLQYLYTGEIVVSAKEINFPAIDDESDEAQPALEEVSKAQELLMDTYILAEMLLDIDAKNALVDEFTWLLRRGRKLLLCPKIEDLFNATPNTSPMRRVLVDAVAFRIGEAGFRDSGYEYSNEFLMEVCLALMAVERGDKRNRLRSKPTRCEYHEHDDAHPQCE